MNKHKSHIRYLLIESKLKEAIDALLEGVKASGQEDLSNPLILLAGRCYSNEEGYRNGTLSLDNYKMEKARISTTLSHYLKEYKPLSNTDDKSGTKPKPKSKPNPNIEEIRKLIDKDLDKAFDILDKYFGTSNAMYNDLCKEYIDRPNNFQMSTFRSRLKRFVKQNLSK